MNQISLDLKQLIKDELLTALGCTEPIAVAYAAAKAKEILGEYPTHVTIKASRDIIKNVHSVAIPNGEDLVGVGAAALLGIFGGDPALGMQVLNPCEHKHVKEVEKLLNSDYVEIKHIVDTPDLAIIVELESIDHQAIVEVAHTHMNIVRMEKDNNVIFSANDKFEVVNLPYWNSLNFNNLYEFAVNSDYEQLQDIIPIIENQKQLNYAIAKEGMDNNWGNNVGKAALYGANSPRDIAEAWAAAGSDARMAGCTKPVVINSGSGNSGITVSVPVYVYGKETNQDEEKINRAIILSNLISLYIKHAVGRLSAYCGAVASGTAAGCAITYLENGDKIQVEKTIINALGNTSGMICDGAKGSCAAKIASSIHAGFLGHKMAMNNECFHNNDGIVKDNADDTIKAVGRLAREGMEITDNVILDIMLNK